MNQNSRQRRGPASRRSILAISLSALFAVVIFALVGATAWSIWRGYQQTLAHASRDALNLARVLSERVGYSVDSAHELLLQIRSLSNRSTARAGQGMRSLQSELSTNRLRNAELYAIEAYDERGQNVASTRGTGGVLAAIGDADFFAALRADTSTGIQIGLQRRADETRLIPIATAIHRMDGSFAGALVATIDTARLRRTLVQLDVNRSIVFSLVRSDGAILFREPGPVSTDAVELDRSLMPLADNASAAVRTLNAADGIARLHAYTR